MSVWRLEVGEPDAGTRLDAFCARATGVSRARLEVWIASGRVHGERGAVTRTSTRVVPGQVWTVHAPDPEPLQALAQPIDLDIVFEDPDVVVVNKPSGLVVHPAPGHASGTLVNGLLHHIDDLEGIGDVLRPGIVHRIDKETSGLLVVSKTDRAHALLTAQFAAHSVERSYHLLCVRVNGPGLEDAGRIETTHGRHPDDRRRFTGRGAEGRRAVTNYRVLERFRDGAMLVEARLETGRTHQIRMHLSEAGCPLLGDELYAGRTVADNALIGRVALHARTLGFTHVDGSRLRFEVEPPEDFATAHERLRNGATWRR
jgi:23S rRNA pseudouridine1911/1915/1917 synthase